MVLLAIVSLVWSGALHLPALEVPEEQADGEQVALLPYPAVGPSHVIPCPAHNEATGVGLTFSLDSPSLMVETHPDAVNIWAVLVSYWPEIMGGLTGLAVLGACLALWRISRRRQLAGHPYCSKCGYCLTGCPGEVCPECGLEDALKRAVVGRSRWRRMLPAMVTAFLAMAVYGALLCSGLPREGKMSTWVNWWSVSLLEWGQDRSLSGITQHSGPVYRLVELDVASGRVVGTLVTLPGRHWVLHTLLPDERAILVHDDRSDADSNKLALLDTRHGQVVRTLPAAGSDVGGWVLAEAERAFAGASSDGLTAYTVWVHEERPEVRCGAWDLLTGKERPVFVREAPRRPNHVVLRRRMVKITCIPGRDSLALEHSGQRGHALDPWQLAHVRDLADQGRVVRSLALRADFARPVFSADGRTMFHPDIPPGDVSAWNLGTGEKAWHILCCPDGWVAGAYAYDSTRHRWFAYTYRPFQGPCFILVGDPRTGEWTHRLTYPDSADLVYSNGPKLSPDGRWLAMRCMRKKEYRTGLGSAFEIVIWDLSALDAESQDDLGTEP